MVGARHDVPVERGFLAPTIGVKENPRIFSRVPVNVNQLSDTNFFEKSFSPFSLSLSLLSLTRSSEIIGYGMTSSTSLDDVPEVVVISILKEYQVVSSKAQSDSRHIQSRFAFIGRRQVPLTQTYDDADEDVVNLLDAFFSCNGVLLERLFNSVRPRTEGKRTCRESYDERLYEKIRKNLYASCSMAFFAISDRIYANEGVVPNQVSE